MPGKGKTITTGKLGDVMQESIQAALSVVRARSRRLGVKEDFYKRTTSTFHFARGRDAEGRAEPPASASSPPWCRYSPASR